VKGVALTADMGERLRQGANLRIESSTAWVTETNGATAGYLKFTAHGLIRLERVMDRELDLILSFDAA